LSGDFELFVKNTQKKASFDNLCASGTLYINGSFPNLINCIKYVGFYYIYFAVRGQINVSE